MAPVTGAQIIARSLKQLGVTVIFGIVGIPVVEIAEEAIDLGIRFIGFRNEQAAGYAASAYGYLTGRPGVFLVVGGPGILHAMPGIGNSSVNAFPLLVLAGSSESHLVSRGAFQELDAIAFLSPHTKIAIRPPSVELVPDIIQNVYRSSWYGRPGPGFVDLPADLIKDSIDSDQVEDIAPVPECPKSGADETKLSEIAQLIKAAKAPLVVIGKGAAYAKVELPIRELIESSHLPFLPTPMGKGVLADSHPLNTASARSSALKEADVVLLLGARLNWILHFGDPPKWNPHVKFIQIDISPEEIGRRSSSDASHSIIGDLATIVPQLRRALGSTWSYQPSSSPYSAHLSAAKTANAATASSRASSTAIPMTFAAALSTIETTLHSLSAPDQAGIVYVSEGANTMDISRSIFPVSYPRLRLDAGTHATMGVGLGYAIAAHLAYNNPTSTPEASSGPPGAGGGGGGGQRRTKKKKKIVALEGDSAFGFSGMEIETMARYGLDVLVFVLNNGGVYHGDADDWHTWHSLQHATINPPLSSSSSSSSSSSPGPPTGLRSTSLSFETAYEKVAHMCNGVGLVARTPAELERATRQGWASERVCVVNVLIEAGVGGKLEFGWQGGGGGGGKRGGKL